MFESFNVPCLYTSVQAVLALYSSGRTSGIVIDSGEETTHFVPIYEGYQVIPAINKLSLGGAHLNAYMIKLLGEKGINMTSPTEYEIVREIKEKMCYVAGDYEAAMRECADNHSIEKTYDLPNG